MRKWIAALLFLGIAAAGYGLTYTSQASPRDPVNPYSSAATFSDESSPVSQDPASTNFSTQGDQKLATQIREKLAPGWFTRGYEQVKVDVNHGIVTLSGKVNSLLEREQLEKAIGKIDGVRSLNNRLIVAEETPASMTTKPMSEMKVMITKDTFVTPGDQELNMKIREKFAQNSLLTRYGDVSLSTNNGIVTLKGFVNSAQDQRRLVDEVQKVEGVTSVNSDLTVKPQ